MKIDAHYPPKNTKLTITHLREHTGAFDRSGKPFKWITVASLLTPGGQLLSTGLARCASMDQPSKKKGFMIAGGRAIKKYLTQDNLS